MSYVSASERRRRALVASPTDTETLHGIMGLVFSEPPSVEELGRRSREELADAQLWAADHYARASDNIIRRPYPRPSWLEDFR